ncbi:MAG: hypothetical protein IJ985_06085 [Akkermansia sp.]|nr:hypothetical protein [Akkermansia sp.]
MPDPRLAMHPHITHLISETDNCVRFISGRAALDCLLNHMPDIRRAYIPLFTCDTVLEPFVLRGIPVQRYRINEDLSPILPINAEKSDLLLLTNYFGFTCQQVKNAAADFPGISIIDATTALYSAPPDNTSCFYSPRKFCDSPTGGLALAPFPLSKLPPKDKQDSQQWLQAIAHHNKQMQVICCERALHHRIDRLSSPDSARWNNVDWQADARQRLHNYAILHAQLKSINRLRLPEIPSSAPMCYPLLSGIPLLRDDLADAGLHLPLFWPEVIRRTTAADWENYLARNLLPLPLGPNISEANICRMAQLILYSS